MDSESETNPSWWYDYEPLINMTEDLNDEQSGNNETQIIEAHDEALNAVPAMGCCWICEYITKRATERLSNSPKKNLKRVADVEQPQAAKLQRISETDRPTKSTESVQVPKTEEASKEAESVALMAETDGLSAIDTAQQLQKNGSRIRNDGDVDHPIYSELPEITALPSSNSRRNRLLMHERRV